MAWYKYGQHLQQKPSIDEFDKDYKPGDITNWSGIYRCEGCGREVVSTSGHPLPPQNHHQHTRDQGSIRWRILVTDRPSD